MALGRIEPKDGVLSLGVPVPDRIRRILKNEGDPVSKGEALAVLDSEVMRELERKLAVIQREQAEKRLTAIEENGNAQIHVEQLRRDQIEQLARTLAGAPPSSSPPNTLVTPPVH